MSLYGPLRPDAPPSLIGNLSRAFFPDTYTSFHPTIAKPKFRALFYFKNSFPTIVILPVPSIAWALKVFPMNSLRVMDVPLIKILDTFMAQVTWRHRMVVALRYVCHILFFSGKCQKNGTTIFLCSAGLVSRS